MDEWCPSTPCPARCSTATTERSCSSRFDRDGRRDDAALVPARRAAPRVSRPREWRARMPGFDPTIRGIRYDSRKVSPGDLFVALRGAKSDGHDYIDLALSLGASALLVGAGPIRGVARATAPPSCVPDSRRALAPLAARFFGDPASELTLVGVTGTNGKTSTTYLVESILAHAGQRVGLVGTVEIRYAGDREVAVNTTPESLDLQRTLRACARSRSSAW